MAASAVDSAQNKTISGDDARTAVESLVGSQVGVDCPEALADWFERVYAQAGRRPEIVPWCHPGANPSFVA